MYILLYGNRGADTLVNYDLHIEFKAVSLHTRHSTYTSLKLLIDTMKFHLS